MDTGVVYCISCGEANESGASFCFKCGKPIKVAGAPVLAKPQSDFITLSCPSCGGKLDITPDMERFACQYCGSEHIVRRTGGAVSLAPVVEGLRRVETKFDQVLSGSDRVAAEQTIQRLKNEMPAYEQRVAEKAAQLKIAPRTPGKIFLRSFLTFLISIPALIMWMVIIDTWYWMDDSLTPILIITTVISSLCIFFIVKLWRRNWKVSARRREKVNQIQSELDQLRSELQERKKQLEQLHRYTAER